jgi:hypothetical protein
MNHRHSAAGDAATAALRVLGGELANRGCHSEVLAGGTAPWLLISNPKTRHRGAAVIAWQGSFWWTWGDCLGATSDVSRAADRVATSLTTPPSPPEAGDQT